ncbi:NAD(P)/FAD-dependent oxidoreductase [Corynebacterium glutamicum]|uniref:NAD(P)/FAD-dependent oxidoreductase n=1 Tax=Corynebacterium glutamicum TaxID=1718 RepID=UPI0009454331|nr:FAD-dependent oxidoreductase [Corynebacterium glutamicum]OKX83677.1 FAD-dependent oxidoreductase [Corynebacterium glutamicum]
MTFDVVIIGAGIVGAACAYSLSQRGLSIAVVDKTLPSNGTSSHCEGNLLVSDKVAGPELDLALHSLAIWPELSKTLEEELGPSFPSLEFEPKGGIVVTTTEAGVQPLIKFAHQQRQAHVDAQVLSLDEALEREPWINPEITSAVYYPQDSQIQPTIATEALLAAARKRGAVTFNNTEVIGLTHADSGSITGIRTKNQTISTNSVVLAAGPWSGIVSERFGAAIPVKPRRGNVLVTSRMPHQVFHKVYDGDYFGATQSAEADLQTAAVVESSQAGTVLIGSSREQVGFTEHFHTHVYAEMARKALRVFPFLANASIMRTYGGFRPYMPDHLPLISDDPRIPGLYHASGHEGAGIGLSVATAEILAARILGTIATSPLGNIDSAPFDLRRPTLQTYLTEALA